MKRTGNKNLKIAAATMMTIFSLFTCFSGAMAWFLGMRTFDDEMDNFEVKATTGVLNKITFHTLTSKQIGNTYAESTFSFSKEPTGTLTYNWETGSAIADPEGNTNITLDSYDYLDHEQPLLLILELSGDITDEVTISLKTDSDNQKFIGERLANSQPAYDLDDERFIIDTGTVVRDEQEINVNYYGLSNAVKFHTVQYNNADFEAAFKNEDYYTFTGLSNQKSFVDIESSGNNQVESSSFATTINPLIKTSGTVNYIAIIVDYYTDAIEYIYSTYLGDSILENDYEKFLYFKCDWSMEVI